MNPRAYLAGLCLLMAGCDLWKNDSAMLTAKTTAPVLGSSCTSCHGYPLKDKNHDYHLFKAGSNQDLNGSITCLDCHAQSVKSQAVVLFDTVYEDTATLEKWRTLSNPGDTARTTDGQLIRGLLFKGVDTLPQNHPVALPHRPAAFPDFQEYVTSLAHMNGKVDVVFDPRNSRPAQFGGDSASYNPKMETCSALACHPGPGTVYSFGSRFKGLPELDSEVEDE